MTEQIVIKHKYKSGLKRCGRCPFIKPYGYWYVCALYLQDLPEIYDKEMEVYVGKCEDCLNKIPVEITHEECEQE